MIEYFRVLMSSEVDEFLASLDEKARNKIIYNIVIHE